MVYMEQNELKNYFNGLIGIPDSFKVIRPLNIPEGLPRLYANQYKLKAIEVLKQPFTLVIPTGEIIEVRKILLHIESLKKTTNRPLILLFKSLKGHQRKTLISHRINFMELTGNIYLPDALLILQKAKEEIEEYPNQLSQWAKIATLKQLIYNNLNDKTISDLAEEFKISKMHASRLTQELKNSNLVKIETIGVTKKINFLPKAELWKKALTFIQTPVIKKIYTDVKPKLTKIAGLTALGELTMLDGRGYTTLAMGKKEYLDIKAQLLPVEKENAKYCIEIWDWSPEILTDKNTVDPVSLYLSLKDSDDDRIQIALKELINEVIGEI